MLDLNDYESLASFAKTFSNYKINSEIIENFSRIKNLCINYADKNQNQIDAIYKKIIYCGTQQLACELEPRLRVNFDKGGRIINHFITISDVYDVIFNHCCTSLELTIIGKLIYFQTKANDREIIKFQIINLFKSFEINLNDARFRYRDIYIPYEKWENNGYYKYNKDGILIS